MRKIYRTLAVLGALSATALPAAGQTTAFWDDVCSIAGQGIAAYPTCASAKLTVFGNGHVDLYLWNLSGDHYTNPNTIYTSVGLGNLDVSLWRFTNLAVTKPNGTAYTNWSTTSNITGLSSAMGFNKSSGSTTGIISENYPTTVGSKVKTPWDDDFSTGGVHFSFTAEFKSVGCPVNKPNCKSWEMVTTYTPKFFDPAGVTLDLHGEKYGHSVDYSCALPAAPTSNSVGVQTTGGTHHPPPTPKPICTPGQMITPEPTTGVLLGTGVFGILGAGFFRRRRRIQR
jgi:hypothetical protein